MCWDRRVNIRRVSQDNTDNTETDRNTHCPKMTDTIIYIYVYSQCLALKIPNTDKQIQLQTNMIPDRENGRKNNLHKAIWTSEVWFEIELWTSDYMSKRIHRGTEIHHTKIEERQPQTDIYSKIQTDKTQSSMYIDIQKYYRYLIQAD